MKKLKLNVLKQSTDVLTREQLKKVMGGDVAADGSCQGSAQECWGVLNCCSGYVCNFNHCHKATV